jgi:hypothetical protein
VKSISQLAPSVTLLKLSVASVDAAWVAGQSAVVLSVPNGITFTSNDRASLYYRKLLSVRIPSISLKMMLSYGPRRAFWVEAAELLWDAYLDIYLCPRGWKESARAQAAFVQSQDELTGRAKVLFQHFDAQGYCFIVTAVLKDVFADLVVDRHSTLLPPLWSVYSATLSAAGCRPSKNF